MLKSYRNKIAFSILSIGTITILILVFYLYNVQKSRILQNNLHDVSNVAKAISSDVSLLLNEKIRNSILLSDIPSIKKALNKSNNEYFILSQQNRVALIERRNRKWKKIKDLRDPFIQKYTDNPLSKYLISIQENFPLEYGEIFITNKYGALVSSTGKLSTLKHTNKYWWKGAHNKGKGRIYLDDRGFDESAQTYVFGVVVPIKENNHIIGIMKFNLKVLGTLGPLLRKNNRSNSFQLIRSNGEIVFEEDIVPLSTSISSSLIKKIQKDAKKYYSPQ